MTTITESPAVREYGVRLRVPGEDDRIIPCGDLVTAESVLTNPPRGVVALEIVGRTVTDWAISPEGLIATVRALAEAHVDDEVSDEQVADRLRAWLPDVTADTLSHAWEDLRQQIEEYRRADDGDVDWAMVEPELRDAELLVQHRDGLVIDAVKRVIGSAA